MSRKRKQIPKAPASLDTAADDPKYVDDGQPVTIRLSLEQSRSWTEDSHLADCYRANMHFHMQKMSEISGRDVILYGPSGAILYHHRQDSALSGES